MDANLYTLLQSRFPRDRAQHALETATGITYSYAQLEETTARYAGFIHALGVLPGDRLCVQVEKSPQALFLYLACLQTGAVFLPLNSAYQQGEVDYFLGDATPKVVVHQPKTEAWMRTLCARHRVAHRFTLADETGVESEQLAGGCTKMRCKPLPCQKPFTAMQTIWPRFSTPREPPAAAKAQ